MKYLKSFLSFCLIAALCVCAFGCGVQVEETIAGLIGRRIRVKILMKDKLSLADQKLRSITVEENLGKLIHTQIESEEESET